MVDAGTPSEGALDPELEDTVRALLGSVLAAGSDQRAAARRIRALCSATPAAAPRLEALLERYFRLGQLGAAQYAALHSAVGVRPDLGLDITRELEAAERELPTLPLAPGESGNSSALPAVPAPEALLCGRYELQGLIGRGANASVYRARDHRRVGLGFEDALVALKVVHADTDAAGSGVAREFRNAQRLSHPNVINVFDIDRDGDTICYSMELLAGMRLSEILRLLGGPLPRAHALAVIRDVGAAITHAHARGVVHADLKPQNIFVTATGEVRVLDFGGVSLTPREPWISEPPAPDTFRPATPAYASCEQLEGQRAEARDDLFALACVSYEVLTGRHPFDHLSAADARSRRLCPRRPPGLSGRAWTALRRALAWQRQRRPVSAETWLAELALSAAAARLPPLEQLRAPRAPRRWPRRLAAVATLALALVFSAYALIGSSAADWQAALTAARHALQQSWRALQGHADAPTAPGPEPGPAGPT